MAALRRLAKTCNFGQNLETALHDQFVCGLCDKKCQRELLRVQELTADVALQKATAAEEQCETLQLQQVPVITAVVNWAITLLTASLRMQHVIHADI